MDPLISSILSEVSHLQHKLSDSMVYSEECKSINLLINNYAKALKTSKYASSQLSYEEEESFERIHSVVCKLSNIVQMLSKDFWGSVALEWSIQKPINEMTKSMESLYFNLTTLGIDVQKYAVDEKMLKKDICYLYLIFNSAKKDVPKLRVRKNSLVKYMNENKIDIPNGKNTFSLNIYQEYLVEHERFTLQKQIGFGATGDVYFGKDLQTGQDVAIKQLKNKSLNKMDIESFNREVAVLSCLKHPYLLKFIGATNKAPYWIITEFMPGKSLYHRLKDRNQLTPFEKTKIAYFIALGMSFLHSKEIIHRDLKTLNILLDAKNEPRICDFGISRKISNKNVPMTGLIGTVNYMAPELCSKTKVHYTLKADVFSYGMILYEMASCEVPFRLQRYDQFKILEVIRSGVRPVIPKDTPKPLKKLIVDCWANQPESRPSFNQVLRRMEMENICFNGANEDMVENFYQEQIIRNQKEQEKENMLKNENEVQKILRIISSSKSGFHHQIQFDELNQCIVTILNNQDLLESLNQTNFVEIATPFLINSSCLNNGLECLITLLLKTTETVESQRSFLYSNGMKLILNLLSNISTRNYGYVFISNLIDLFDQDQLFIVLDNLLKLSKYNSSMKVIKRTKLDGTSIIKNYLQEIISYNNKDKNKNQLESRSFLLSQYISKEGITDYLVSELTVKFVIEMGSFELIEKLLSFNLFKNKINNDDIMQICNILSSSEYNMNNKYCAILILDSLPYEVLKYLVKFPKFINDIIKINNVDFIGKFLYKICTFPEGSETLICQPKFLEENIENPRILSLFILLCSFYPKETLRFAFLFKNIIKFIKERKYIETILRIIGTLSSYTNFQENPEIIDELIQLLKESYCNEMELTLLIGIFYNISNSQNDNVYPFNCIYTHLLKMAESNTPYRGLALSILANNPLPSPNSRLSGRIFDLIPKFIEDGDIYGKVAVGKLLTKISQNELYLKVANQKSFESLINSSIIKTKNVNVLISLCEAVISLEYELTQESLNYLSSYILSPNVSTENANKMRFLQNKFRTSLKTAF